MSIAQQTVLTHPPFPPQRGPAGWSPVGLWPAQWITLPGANPPTIVAFRCRFTLTHAAALRLHVSADERYVLYLDARRIARGPQRGDLEHWRFESLDIQLPRGRHVLVALVQALGELAPFAQLTAGPPLAPGLLVAPDDPSLQDTLATGRAPWDARPLAGLSFTPGPHPGMVGPGLRLDAAAYPWGVEAGRGRGWRTTVVTEPAVHAGMRHGTEARRRLTPAELPAMLEQPLAAPRVRFVGQLDTTPSTRATKMHHEPVQTAHSLAHEESAWQALLTAHSPLEVPAHAARRVVIDLGDYHCVYPVLVTRRGRGARVDIAVIESLYDQPLTPASVDPAADAQHHNIKGDRDAVDGKYFRCQRAAPLTDVFWPDGHAEDRRFESHWWRAGRYVQIVVRAADEAMVIQSLHFEQTHYPLAVEAQWECDDPRFAAFWPLGVRALAMCMHETYMDCPAYEQLMYIGDTRLQALVTCVLTHDHALSRKALRLFDRARDDDGLAPSRHPSRVPQRIGPFSLLWTGMLRDFAFWRDDPAFVAAMLPGMRRGLEAVLQHRNADGLVDNLPGWNFIDWVERHWQWREGTAPEGDAVGGPLNWTLTLALTDAVVIEQAVGEPQLADRWSRLADALGHALRQCFWNADRRLFADDLHHRCFSQHSQCLAVLTGRTTADQNAAIAAQLLNNDQLAPVSIYFSHYLFEAMRVLGLTDRLVEHLDPWFTLSQQGFRTTPEWIRPAVRSDCHAWGAHPLFHYFATILGIRPAAPGFHRVDISPCPGPLTRLRGRMPHPRGFIEVALRREGDRWTGRITLPPDTPGSLTLNGQTRNLPAGQVATV